MTKAWLTSGSGCYRGGQGCSLKGRSCACLCLLPEGSLGHPHASICQSNLDHRDPETLFSEDAGSEQQACRATIPAAPSPRSRREGPPSEGHPHCLSRHERLAQLNSGQPSLGLAQRGNPVPAKLASSQGTGKAVDKMSSEWVWQAVGVAGRALAAQGSRTP